MNGDVQTDRSGSTPGKVKCLVVDDLDDNLFTMAALLRDDEVEVLTARSGPQALELLQVNDVALALLDVQMPQMDGFELAELMRSSERTRQVPIIFVTAGARDLQRMFKGYDAGAVDFLFKPVEPWILQSKARVFFELHRARRRLAQELKERSETLRQQEIFSAVLAHDLRDPLNAIVTSAALIERLADADAVRAAARRIAGSGHAMSRMIGDVLDLARTRHASGIPLRPEPGDLRPAFERVLDEQRRSHPQRVLRVAWHGDLTGLWDGSRLGQVLANLVGNACQYSVSAAPVDVTVDGSTADAVVLTVRSEGAIPGEQRAHLFNPFRRGAGSGGAGLGLGLYIVEQVVRGHGGTVEVLDEDGCTVFSVRLSRRGAAPA